MEEDGHTAREREQLKREMRKLRQAVSSIAELESSSTADPEQPGTRYPNYAVIDDDEATNLDYEMDGAV
jgi:hypothetical protein